MSCQLTIWASSRECARHTTYPHAQPVKRCWNAEKRGDRIAPSQRGICGECDGSHNAMSVNAHALYLYRKAKRFLSMSMDTPDNYYAILGVPIDADSDTLKRAYRQLARRYHPDLAGPDGAVQMKRINRAYDVLSDPEKRLNYDTIIGGVIDLRKGGLSRPRPKEHKFDPNDDIEFSGLSIFSTKGPLHIGPVLRSSLGVVSALSSVS